MNRIISAIEKQKSAIIAKGLSVEKIDELYKALDMSMVEYVRFQEAKSLAFIDGRLSLEEANCVYAYLGSTPDHFNKQPLAVKIVLTKLFSELLGD